MDLRKHIKLLFCTIALIMTSEGFAQQLPQYSQYILNRYVINPASAGADNYFVGQTNYRNQWQGIKDAPSTYILSVNGPLGSNMGVGGYLFSDVTGPTRRNGFNLSYAYKIKINDELKLSMAINAGLLQYTVDGTEITFAEDGDDILASAQENNLFPDAGFSLYLYGPNYFFGASAPQLIRNQLDFENSIEDPTGRLTSHYFITGGYTFELNSDFELEPSMLLKYVEPVPLQYEFSARGIYKEFAWLGVSYRKTDAIVMLVGFTLQENISLGYAYDFIQSDLGNYSSGSHEIMLSVRFNKRKSPIKDLEE
jgi:type IX secretion system PorP/SprF family membrane protein